MKKLDATSGRKGEFFRKSSLLAHGQIDISRKAIPRFSAQTNESCSTAHLQGQTEKEAISPNVSS